MGMTRNKVSKKKKSEFKTSINIMTIFDEKRMDQDGKRFGLEAIKHVTLKNHSFKHT